MPVGNDVVDLRDAETRPGATHPRFDLRVFTPAERERLHEALRPVRLRWSLWAAKESAYKAARQLQPDLPFHPREFATRVAERAGTALERAEHALHDAGDALRCAGADLLGSRSVTGVAQASRRTGIEVAHRLAGRFHVWVEEARDWIHAVARTVDEREWMPVVAMQAMEDASADASRRVRELATLTVAPLVPADPGDLEVVSEGGVPRLRHGGEAVPVELSLSHHGRLVACAVGDTRN